MASAAPGPPSPAIYHRIYTEIEEVGWENLVHSSEDLSSLSFRVTDQKGRPHILEIALPRNYPECLPSVAADVPCIFELNWTRNSNLKDVVQQFIEHLQNLQEFWFTLDDIDRSLLVVEPKQPSNSTSYRQFSLGNDCSLLVSIDPYKPRSIPEYRFFGPDKEVDEWINSWRKNTSKWDHDKPLLENLMAVLETSLPRPAMETSINNEQVECGICYAQYLPINDELGASSGTVPSYTCDNSNCRKAFHSVCLRDWSFDVLFGNCPYCSELVAVKVND